MDATPPAESRTEAELRRLLEQVNEWLRFAEAKNGALVAASLAATYAFGRLLSGAIEAPGAVEGYAVFVALPALLLSAAIALASFAPQLTPPDASPRGLPRGANLLFFDHVADHTPDSFLAALARLIDAEPTTLARAYAEQVVANSRITRRKLAFFKCALWLAILAITTPVIAVPLFLLSRRSNQEMDQ